MRTVRVVRVEKTAENSWTASWHLDRTIATDDLLSPLKWAIG